jgi:hypothetical protein
MKNYRAFEFFKKENGEYVETICIDEMNHLLKCLEGIVDLMKEHHTIVNIDEYESFTERLENIVQSFQEQNLDVNEEFLKPITIKVEELSENLEGA